MPLQSVAVAFCNNMLQHLFKAAYKKVKKWIVLGSFWVNNVIRKCGNGDK